VTTTIVQFSAGHDGGGGPPNDRVDVISIGGTASAGDILQVTTVANAGSWDEVPSISDDVSGSSGWSIDFDATDGSDLRSIGFQKVAVGGETTITTTWTGAVNHVTQGFWASNLTLPRLVFLSTGNPTNTGPNLQYTNTGTIPQDHSSYVGGTCWTGSGVSDAEFTHPPSPPAEGGSGTLTAGNGAGCVSHYNTDELTNTAADTLIYQFAPTTPVAVRMFWYAFADAGLEVTGVGHLFIGGTVDLESMGGGVEITGTGHLVGGSVEMGSSGGELHVRGRGRFVGGSSDLSGRVPFPQPIRRAENQLGCGIYQAFAMTRGLGEIVTMLPFTELDYARILDETSTASLTIDGVSNPRAIARCCAALSELEPEEHELCIIRNGWRVWSGPITDMSFPSEQCVIQASDLSWWLSARTIHDNINSVQQDLVNILVAYVQDAMSVDNSAGLYATVLALAGELGDRLVQASDHQLASDVIGELSRTGVDWTTIDRKMLVGPLLPQPAPFPGATPYPTLIDANFRIQPTILVSGSQGGNCFYVNGPPDGAGDLIFGEYGPHFPATPDHVEQPAAPDYAAIEAQFGRIERVVTESRILDQAGIDANAQTRYELLKRPLVYISDGALLPSTPIPMEKLIPGSIVNVHLSNVCRVIGEPYRIKQVSVKASSDGSEEVDVQWQPLGTGVVLDGEL